MSLNNAQTTTYDFNTNMKIEEPLDLRSHMRFEMTLPSLHHLDATRLVLMHYKAVASKDQRHTFTAIYALPNMYCEYKLLL